MRLVLVILLVFCAGCGKKVLKVDAVNPVVTAPTKVEKPVIIRTPVGRVASVTQRTVYFDFNDAGLRPEGIGPLEEIAKAAGEKVAVVSVTGHCDERGSVAYNYRLGLERARTVQEWLITAGIPRSMVEVDSKGEERLVAFGCYEDFCHQKNRRCEVVLK